jgi:hypothetical protein
MIRVLKNENIGYDGLKQVLIDQGRPALGSTPADVSTMRCEGVVPVNRDSLVASRNEHLVIRFGMVGAFVVAGVLNSGEWIYGLTPTLTGTLASVLALVCWPAYAAWVSRRAGARWVFPTAFWLVVLACVVVGPWAYSLGVGTATASEGLGTVLLLFIGSAPSYGLTRLLGQSASLLTAGLVCVAVYGAATTLFLVLRRQPPSSPVGMTT